MTQIDNITDDADQLTQVVLDDGSIMQLEIFYNPATQRWAFNMTHTLLTVQGVNLDLSPNLLRQWRNVIPFGFACNTITGVDPTNIEDFVNGNAALYALNAADVLLVEENVYGGVLQ